MLYRGMSIRGSLRPPQNHSFTSATFSRQVAEGHFDASLPGAEAAMTRVLLSQSVPTSRVFMTFYETSQMNANFLEAEAVLLRDPDNSTF